MHIISDARLIAYSTPSVPWATIDDELCEPPGCLRAAIEDAVRRGLLKTDGVFVSPANPDGKSWRELYRGLEARP